MDEFFFNINQWLRKDVESALALVYSPIMRQKMPKMTETAWAIPFYKFDVTRKLFHFSGPVRK